MKLSHRGGGGNSRYVRQLTILYWQIFITDSHFNIFEQQVIKECADRENENDLNGGNFVWNWIWPKQGDNAQLINAHTFYNFKNCPFNIYAELNSQKIECRSRLLVFKNLKSSLTLLIE